MSNPTFGTVTTSRKTVAQIGGYGSRAGWLDPFAAYSPLDLIGTNELPGAYYRMRHGHPLIKSILDRRRDVIASTPIQWSGPHAEVLNQFWDQLARANPNLKLSRLLASIIDEKTSFGFALYERRWHHYGLELLPVDPRTIFEFIQPDRFAVEPDSIRFISTAQSTTIPFSNFYLFSNRAYETNWWGESILYCLLRDFLTWETEWKTYVSARMLEKGVIIAKEVGSGSTTTRDEIQGAIGAILRGQDVGIMTDGQWEFEVLQVSNGQDAVKQKIDLDNAFAETIRQTLNSNLNTLGLSSVGSKALAETLKINDEESFEAFLEKEFEDFCGSRLVEDLSFYLGIPQSEIAISTFGAEYKSSAIDPALVWGLVEKGIISLQSLGPDNTAMMIEALGLDPTTTAYINPTAQAIVEDTIPEADTNLPPASVRKSSALAIAKIYALPKEQRGILSGHELALVRKIASNAPLPMRNLAQWDAILDAELANPNPIRLESFGGPTAREWLDSQLNPAIEEDIEGEAVLSEESYMAVPEKYSHIDFIPPEGVREAAKRGLEVRASKPPSQRGGTAVGIARARDLFNGKNISPDTAKRMKAYFDRHEVDKQGSTWDEQGKGWQAWSLWGGDPGYSWAKKLVKQMNAADEKE